MSEIFVQESKQDQNALVLTISKQSFGEFIRDLISEKRNIRRDIKASFVLSRADFLDLISLVNQRVNLQNQVILSTIAVEILYRDGYMQGFESLDAFNSSRDARQSEVCAVHCQLTYVLKFPNREKPEKQEVSIFIRNIRAFEESVSSKESFQWLFPEFAFADETGHAAIRLEYTEISWGYDIENLISQYLMSKMSRSKLTGFRFLGVAAVILLTIAGVVIYSGREFERYTEQDKARAVSLIDSNTVSTDTEKISKKIDLLISRDRTTLNEDQRRSILIRAVGISILGLTVTLMIAIRRQSYLIINEFTERLYTRHRKNYDYIRYALATSFIVGLLASLGASFLYDVIKH